MAVVSRRVRSSRLRRRGSPGSAVRPRRRAGCEEGRAPVGGPRRRAGAVGCECGHDVGRSDSSATVRRVAGTGATAEPEFAEGPASAGACRCARVGAAARTGTRCRQCPLSASRLRPVQVTAAAPRAGACRCREGHANEGSPRLRAGRGAGERVGRTTQSPQVAGRGAGTRHLPHGPRQRARRRVLTFACAGAVRRADPASARSAGGTKHVDT
jgi:hypothetical protein